MLEIRFLKSIALLVCVLGMAAAGCGGRQVLNVSSPVVTAKGPVSEEEVRQAILRACAVTDWVIAPGSSTINVMTVTKTVGRNSATVNIGYAADRYTIVLSETTMMDLPPTRGYSGGTPGGAAAAPAASTTVHRTYNRWVQELDQQIRGQLRLIGL